MKLRNVGIIATILLAAAAQCVHAVGLGELKLNSVLNEPLDARIQLTNVGELSDVEMLVGLASADEFRAARVEREFYLTALQFQVDLSNPRDPFIRVTTNQPVNEPYLDFLVSLEWPTGKLLREYTLLLDLPTFVTKKSAPQRIQSATASQVVQKTAEAPQAPLPEAGGEYQVAGGDTLWSIATDSRPTGYSIPETMTAIQRLNPRAFINNNIDLLKKGAILRLPKGSQIENLQENSSNSSPVQQVLESSLEPELYSSVDETSDDVSGADSAEPAASSSGGVLKLAALGSGELSDGGYGFEGGDDSPAAGVAAAEGDSPDQVSILEEELTRTRSENDELKARLANLEEQLETMERMAEIKSGTGAAIQASAEQATQAAPKAPASKTQQNNWLSWLIYGAVALVGIVIAAFLITRNKRKEEDQVEFEPVFAASPRDSKESFEDTELEDSFVDDEEMDDVDAEALVDLELSDEEAMDPVEQADIYLSLGNEEEAENILQEALREDVHNVAAHLKLLEIYAKQLDLPQFDMQRAELAVLDNQEANLTAERLRDELIAAEELQASEMVDENTETPDLSLDDESLDLDQLSSDIDDLDLDGVFDEADQQTSGASLEITESDITQSDIAQSSESGDISLETELEESLNLEDEAMALEEELSPDQFDNIEEPGEQEISVTDADIDGPASGQTTSEDLQLPEEAELEEAFGVSDTPEAHADGDIDVEEECNTKLELAQAYMDMGDVEGATEILQEVLADGSDQQREKARSLMDAAG